MEADGVGSLKEFSQRLHADDAVPDRLVVVGIVGDHVEPDPFGQFCGLFGNRTEAHQPEGVAVELPAAVVVSLPAARSDVAVGRMEVSLDAEQQGDSVFGDRAGVDAGGVADDDIPLAGGVDIDIVEAAAVFGDHLQSIGSLDHVGVQRGDTDDHRVVAVDIVERGVDAVVFVHAGTLREISDGGGACGIDRRRQQHLPGVCHSDRSTPRCKSMYCPGGDRPPSAATGFTCAGSDGFVWCSAR